MVSMTTIKCRATDNLTVSEKRQLFQLLIKQITYYKDSIKIDLYEFPRIDLDLETHPEFLDERLEWLPVPTSQRTISVSVARHRVPIYMAYHGRSIGMIFGIASIEPDETGIVPSDGLKAMERNHKWQNPLKLASKYQAFLKSGKTKADIARMVGSSRARVTQIMSLLSLHPDIQEYLNNAKHDLGMKLLTERKLREIAIIQDSNEQLRAFGKLIR
jgi:hypothetical protein